MDEILVTRGSKILFHVLWISIVISISFSFYKYLFLRDYQLYIKVECDPERSTCFKQKCEKDDVRCNAYPNGIYYYKILFKNAYKTVPCTTKNCPAPVCTVNEEGCKEYYCSKENIKRFDLDATCSRI